MAFNPRIRSKFKLKTRRIIKQLMMIILGIVRLVKPIYGTLYLQILVQHNIISIPTGYSTFCKINSEDYFV